MNAKNENADFTDNQTQFINDARAQGFDVDFDYSGRGMYGATCPAVRLDRVAEFRTDADYTTDQMGLGYVVYARN